METPAEHENEMPPVELRDNSRRAKFVLLIFSITVGILIIGVWSDYLELDLLQRVQSEGYVEMAEAETNDSRQTIISLFQTAVLITSMILFLHWFRRAYGNLHRSGVSTLQHSETMAVWAWIIPIIWFYRPYRIMKEIWIETQLLIQNYDQSYNYKSGTLLLGSWWTLFIITNFIGNYILKSLFKEDTIERLIERAQATLLSDAMQIAEALLVLLIVSQISKMEARLSEEVIKSGGKMAEIS